MRDTENWAAPSEVPRLQEDSWRLKRNPGKGRDCNGTSICYPSRPRMLNDIWRFRLLGGLQAQQGSVATERFRTRKTAALLAYLAFYPHTAHSREELATLLWPDATPELGLKSLGVALSSLRKLLEPPGVPAGSVLVADRRTARLRPEAIETDVAGFRQALEAARAGGVQQRRTHLEAAIGLYGGDLLHGFMEEWILPERDLLGLAYR